MSHTQSTQPSQPYDPQVPPPGSLQEWMVRALAVRAVQEMSDEPGTEPAEAGQQRAEPVTPPVSTVPAEPAQPIEPGPTRADVPWVRLAAERRRIQLTARSVLARLQANRVRIKLVSVVVVVAAALTTGVGWQLSQAGRTPTAPQAAIGALGTSSAVSELPTPAVTRPVKPAAFGQVVKLDGWQVKIAVMKNSPQLKAVPGLTTAAYPRALRMSVTLINTTDHALAADGWALSATVNGKPVQMIIHPPAGYVGVPHQTIKPGGSIVFPVAVSMPTGWANLVVDAVHADASLAMSFAGKG